MDADDVLAVAERALTGHEPANPAEALAASHQLVRHVTDRHQRAIIAARDAGATWLQIAHALGTTTKQAGRQAWERAASAQEAAKRS